jgi:hypothetical protein
MYVKVRSETVRRNIEIFKIIAKRASHVFAQAPLEKNSQDFKAFIHRLKGEIRFADLSSEPLEPRDWISASLHISLPGSKEDAISVEIFGTDGAMFSWDGMEHEALDVLKETIKTIRFMARFLPKLRSLSGALRELSQMNLDAFLDELPAKDLIHEAWRQIPREDCEYLLALQNPGTFLFRQDEFAALLERQLKLAHKMPIKCITLTYVDEGKKIIDKTLVKKKEGWIIYDNDPTLDGTIYPSARALLDSFRACLQRPLLNF